MSPSFPNEERMQELADGRTLCFAEYGAPEGQPVFYLHGAGSSRFEGSLYHGEAAQAGVRLIATDRPGCGGSSPQAGRTVTGYADDLRELADALGLDRFVVAGMSNGGMFAMAVALALPGCVIAAIPINASTPLHDPAARRATPLRVRLLYALTQITAPGMRWLMKTLARRAKADDSQWRIVREAVRQPDSGYLEQEVRLASAPWGFDHTAVSVTVEFFSGTKDPGYAYAPHWVEALPDARLHTFPGGHGGFAEPKAIREIVAVMHKCQVRQT
jgi:pimeloyl-ACP methyl ester carboxylesterase